MVSVFYGDNQFALQRAIQERCDARGLVAEHKNGSDMTHADFIEAFQGVHLFAPERITVLHELSAQPDLFKKLPDMLDATPETTDVIIVEETLDKRTAVYKTLAKAGVVKEFARWTERDRSEAVKWCVAYAVKLGATLSAPLANSLIDRVGFDQWALASAIEKLALLEAIDAAALQTHIDAEPQAAVFSLLEAALEGRRTVVREIMQDAQATQDVYRLFGLVSTQVVQLAAMEAAQPNDTPTKDMGIHPYVAGKLQKQARALGKQRVRHAVRVFAQADADLKRSKADPWLLLEKALLELSAE